MSSAAVPTAVDLAAVPAAAYPPAADPPPLLPCPLHLRPPPLCPPPLQPPILSAPVLPIRPSQPGRVLAVPAHEQVEALPLNIPENVTDMLGEEGCRELRQSCSRKPWGEITEQELLEIHVPGLVDELLFDRAQQDVQIKKLETWRETETLAAVSAECTVDSLREELGELRAELLVANACVRTLQGVIRDHVCREAR